MKKKTTKKKKLKMIVFYKKTDNGFIAYTETGRKHFKSLKAIKADYKKYHGKLITLKRTK